MKFNTDREWLKRKAEQEGNTFVSVGGLISSIEDAPPSASAPQPIRSVFIRFLQLARRERELTLEQFADQAKIGADEAWSLENDEHFRPTPRAIHMIAEFLRIPQEKLMVLSGLLQPKDVTFQREALRFAARSERVEKLRREEHDELEEYVKFLSER